MSIASSQKFDLTLTVRLGCAGELGAIFSCPSAGDSPSQLFYKPYESWTALQTWSASLPAGEQATALAIGGMGPTTDGSAAFDDPTVGLTGSGTILVATSRGFVRFFSGAGLQKYIWNVGEEVVAMAAGKDWAMVVYRAGAGAGLDYSLIDTDTYEVVQQGKVPLSKGATLTWLGFTNDNVSRRLLAFSASVDAFFCADSCHVRFEGCAFDPRPLATTSSRSLASCARHEHAAAEGGQAGVILARRRDGPAGPRRDSQGARTCSNVAVLS